MTIIITKNSSTAGAAPTSSDLVQGELAVNVTDKRLYTENASGTVVELGTNPSVPVTFPDGSASAPSLTNDGDTNTGVYFPAADTVGITTGGTERVRVDSSGNVGIGTSSPSAKLEVNGGSSGGALTFNSTTTGTSNTITSILNNGNAYANMNYSALNHIFKYGATEGMRIDSSGNLLVGTTSTGPFTGKVTLSGDSGTTKWSVGPYTGNAGGFVVSANTSYGVYLPTTTSTSWATASDERIKTALEPIENAAEKVSTLRAVTGKYKTDENGPRKPFLIAQDVLAVFPEAVDTSNPEKYGIAYSEMIPLLVAAIKEQQAIITQLQADVAALKGQA